MGNHLMKLCSHQSYLGIFNSAYNRIFKCICLHIHKHTCLWWHVQRFIRIPGNFFSFFFFFFRFYLFIFREGEGKEKERERNIIVWLPLTCFPLDIWPATQACALTRNWTSDLRFTSCAQSTELHQPGLLLVLGNTWK